MHGMSVSMSMSVSVSVFVCAHVCQYKSVHVHTYSRLDYDAITHTRIHAQT